MPSTAASSLEAWQGRASARVRVAAGFLLVAVAILPFADLAITGHNPWAEVLRIGAGLLTPSLSALEDVGWAAVLTVSFALAAVACGALAGFLLAPFYELAPIRWISIVIRSIHELFWALILMQVFGISVLTGVLAIAIPYTGIFAKVFAEYLEEADRRPGEVLPPNTDPVSAFFLARLPLALPEIKTYTMYRIECGIRSSAVLGFIGLPTLGFELDAVFKQGDYSAVGAVLLIYFAIIASLRHWMAWRLVPAYLAASTGALMLVHSPPVGANLLWGFLTHDIVPAPLRNGDWSSAETWLATWAWLRELLVDEALPGLAGTLIVAQLALVLTGMLALTGLLLLVPAVVGRVAVVPGHLGLVVGRSTPEYMLAYVFLQILGPSMLPAVLALGLHNGAIIAHLLGRQANAVVPRLRADAPRGLDLAGFELLPRLYGSFLALCLYRWEIIVRESAIIGILGIATLGFHVDSAMGELKMDRVVILLAVTVLATAAIEALSRWLRKALRPAAAGLM